MKKLLFIFLIVFLYSCEKPKEAPTPIPEKFCWTCEFDYPNFNGYGPYQLRWVLKIHFFHFDSREIAESVNQFS